MVLGLLDGKSVHKGEQHPNLTAPSKANPACISTAMASTSCLNLYK